SEDIFTRYLSVQVSVSESRRRFRFFRRPPASVSRAFAEKSPAEPLQDPHLLSGKSTAYTLCSPDPHPGFHIPAGISGSLSSHPAAPSDTGTASRNHRYSRSRHIRESIS